MNMIGFIRDQIDGDPNLLSTITQNDGIDEYRKLCEAYNTYMRKYGKEYYEKGTARKDVEDFLKLVNAVQVFKQIAQDEEMKDLLLPETPKHILPPSKTMSSKTFTTPSKKKILSSLYNDSSDDNSNDDEDKMGAQFLEALKKQEEYKTTYNSDDDDPKDYKPISRNTSKRVDKTMKTVKKHLKDDYEFDNRTVNTSEFRDSLWNILINGNYRVKFSPKCATRTGAKEYCKRKFDGNGYPLYRLIPPNDTDDFNNQICDLNDDKVDDVVIVDKSGRPVIINGYKLVKASPYKKIWQEERARKGGKILPFNYCLQKKFDLAHTWDYSKEVWEKGERYWVIM